MEKDSRIGRVLSGDKIEAEVVFDLVTRMTSANDELEKKSYMYKRSAGLALMQSATRDVFLLWRGDPPGNVLDLEY